MVTSRPGGSLDGVTLCRLVDRYGVRVPKILVQRGFLQLLGFIELVGYIAAHTVDSQTVQYSKEERGLVQVQSSMMMPNP